MRIKHSTITALHETIIVMQNSIGLIATPYFTMRHIALRPRTFHALLYIILAFLYLGSLNMRRIWFFLLQMTVTFVFFYAAAKVYRRPARAVSVISLFSYTLLPTIIWFFTNRLISYVLPPPRTTSMLGVGFSVLFVAFSISLLVWKAILFYLAARYSLRQHFFTVMYTIVLYIPIAISLTYLGYVLGISRVPFL